MRSGLLGIFPDFLMSQKSMGSSEKKLFNDIIFVFATSNVCSLKIYKDLDPQFIVVWQEVKDF